MSEPSHELFSPGYGTRSVPTTINVYLFLEFTIVRHFQGTANLPSAPCQGGNPMNRDLSGRSGETYQGDFEDFAQVEVGRAPDKSGQTRPSRCSLDIALRWSEKLNQSTIPTHQWIFNNSQVRLFMSISELISSPPFLIIVAIFAIFLVIGIAKRALRLLIWITVIFVILVCFGIAKQADLLAWFENFFKIVK